MLVLSRLPSESILIGDDIEIIVLRCDNGQVRLGIEAPKNINIVRSELIMRQEDDADRERFTKAG